MIRILGLMIVVLGASVSSAAPAPDRFTAEQLDAQLYFDLGADQIDVSGYPKAQQENYKVFAAVCSRCHTLARPINSPLATRADWKRFIERMHVRSKIEAGKTFTKEEAKTVVEFLAYDSNIRKIQHKAEFDAETERLKKLFVEVRAERSRLQTESDEKKAMSHGNSSQ